MTRGRHATTVQKLEWLRINRPLWESLPPWDDWVKSPRWNQPKLHALREAAVDVGLYSSKTFWRDVEYSLMQHIRMLHIAEKLEA